MNFSLYSGYFGTFSFFCYIESVPSPKCTEPRVLLFRSWQAVTRGKWRQNIKVQTNKQTKKQTVNKITREWNTGERERERESEREREGMG